MKNVIRILLCAILISGCASSDYRDSSDQISGKRQMNYKPSYDPNYQMQLLRNDLIIQSIIQNGEIEKMKQEMQRMETQRLQRENQERMERVKEQQRQIEQIIQEDNRKHEMHKLKNQLLQRGIY